MKYESAKTNLKTNATGPKIDPAAKTAFVPAPYVSPSFIFVSCVQLLSFFDHCACNMRPVFIAPHYLSYVAPCFRQGTTTCSNEKARNSEIYDALCRSSKSIRYPAQSPAKWCEIYPFSPKRSSPKSAKQTIPFHTERQTNRQTNRQTDRRTDTDTDTDRQRNRLTGGQTNGKTNGRTNGQRDKQTNRRT